jgi:tetratricopeptide (TPR) repeat protein
MEAAIELYPTASMGYLQLAGLLLDNEWDAKYALELARFGLSLEPVAQPATTAVFAAALAYNGKFDEAANAVKSVDGNRIAFAAEKASWFYYQAVIAKLEGRLSEARELCERAVAADPNGDSGDEARKLLETLD